MGYQKISDSTEERVRNFIREYMKAIPAGRGQPKKAYLSDYHISECVTFNEAIETLLAGMGF